MRRRRAPKSAIAPNASIAALPPMGDEPGTAHPQPLELLASVASVLSPLGDDGLVVAPLPPLLGAPAS